MWEFTETQPWFLRCLKKALLENRNERSDVLLALLGVMCRFNQTLALLHFGVREEPEVCVRIRLFPLLSVCFAHFGAENPGMVSVSSASTSALPNLLLRRVLALCEQ